MKEWAARRGATAENDSRPAFILPLGQAVLPPPPRAAPTLGDWMTTLRAATMPADWDRFQLWLGEVSFPAFLVQLIPTGGPLPAVAVLDLPVASTEARRSYRMRFPDTPRRRGGSPSGAVDLQLMAHTPIRPRQSIRLDADYLARRGGAVSLGDKTVVVVGCGSIGSQIARHLSLLGVGTLVLIDPETLEPDNIHRHALGLQYCGFRKARALKLTLEHNYPHQRVESFHSDFEGAWRESPQTFDTADLIVFATGDETAERRADWLTARAPRIHAWVEPLGLAGHILGTVPTHSGSAVGCFECLFRASEAGPLTNMASLAQPDERHVRTLAGCAGFHTPFSALDAARTALEASNLAVAMLTGQQTVSTLITWRGDRKTFLDADFALTSRGHGAWPALELINADGFADSACPVCRASHSVPDSPCPPNLPP